MAAAVGVEEVVVVDFYLDGAASVFGAGSAGGRCTGWGHTVGSVQALAFHGAGGWKSGNGPSLAGTTKSNDLIRMEEGAGDWTFQKGVLAGDRRYVHTLDPNVGK